MFNHCQVNNMEECYKYFSCSKTDCPAYGSKGINCWKIEGTLCHHPLVEFFDAKLSETGKRKCDGCVYYVIAGKGWSIMGPDNGATV